MQFSFLYIYLWIYLQTCTISTTSILIWAWYFWVRKGLYGTTHSLNIATSTPFIHFITQCSFSLCQYVEYLFLFTIVWGCNNCEYSFKQIIWLYLSDFIHNDAEFSFSQKLCIIIFFIISVSLPSGFRASSGNSV